MIVVLQEQQKKVNNIMNYLTQHYKNLSEQLQQKVNHLHHLIRLSEANSQTQSTIDKDIQDQENIQKSNVKNATKIEQGGRVDDDIAHAVVVGPVMTGSIGALGLMAGSALPASGALAGAAGALAAPAAIALGAAGAGYVGGKAIQAGMDYFDPEQKTYAKIGSAITGGPEKVERKGAPGTQAEYSNAAKTAAAARKARYGTQD